jgi:hypothetical protein
MKEPNNLVIQNLFKRVQSYQGENNFCQSNQSIHPNHSLSIKIKVNPVYLAVQNDNPIIKAQKKIPFIQYQVFKVEEKNHPQSYLLGSDFMRKTIIMKSKFLHVVKSI